MQFRGYSLPVHDCNGTMRPSPCPISLALIRPRDLFRLLAIGMCHFLPVYHLGIAFLGLGRRSKYNTYIHIYMQNTYWRNNKDERHSLRKIYLSLYWKGLCVRVSWRPNRTAIYWLPSPSGHSCVSFSFSWTTQPEAWGPSHVGAVPSTASCLQLIWSPN